MYNCEAKSFTTADFFLLWQRQVNDCTEDVLKFICVLRAEKKAWMKIFFLLPFSDEKTALEGDERKGERVNGRLSLLCGCVWRHSETDGVFARMDRYEEEKHLLDALCLTD